jgi:hypothetical protein
MSNKDTIEKAYGNFNKEIPGTFILEWLPTMRGFKYYYLKLVRFFTGR